MKFESAKQYFVCSLKPIYTGFIEHFTGSTVAFASLQVPQHFVCEFIGFLWAVNFRFIISSAFSVLCIFWSCTLSCREIRRTRIEEEREKVK